MNGNLNVKYDTSMNGNVQIGGNLTVNGNLTAVKLQNKYIINTTTNNYQLIVSEDISLNGRLFVSGNVGIGIGATDPAYKLDIVSTTGKAPFNVMVGTTNALSVNSSGFVGLGTTGPTNLLQIACTSSTNHNEPPDGGSNHGLLFTSPKTGGSSTYSMAMGVDNGTGHGYINCAGNSALQPLLLQSRGGNVGIGKTDPAVALDVNGSLIVKQPQYRDANMTLALTSSKSPIRINGDLDPNDCLCIGLYGQTGGANPGNNPAGYIQTIIDAVGSSHQGRPLLLNPNGGNIGIGGNISMDPTFTKTTITPNNSVFTAINTQYTINDVGFSVNHGSEFNSTIGAYNAFNNNATSYYHSLSGVYNTTTGVGTRSTTNVKIGASTNQTIFGEWIQIVSSLPLTLESYKFGLGGITARFIKEYYIIASTNGTNWTAIQFGSISSSSGTAQTIIPTAISIPSTSPVITNYINTGTLTITDYAETNINYTYFRLVVTKIQDIGQSILEIGEWVVNFGNYMNSIQINKMVSNKSNMILSIDGSVGIGTTNPGSPLTIYGGSVNNSAVGINLIPSNTRSSLFIDTTAYLLGSNAGNLSPIITLKSSSVGNISYLNIYNYRHGNNGTDWLTSSTRIQQTIDATNMGYIEFNPPGNPYGIGLYTTGVSGTNHINATTQGITITSTGNVGIGKTDPVVALDVNGATSLNGMLFTSGDVSLNGNLTLANKGNLVIQNNSFARTFSPTSANAIAASWNTTVDGDIINWNSSSSSNYPTLDSYKAFDNNNGTSWASFNEVANLYSVTGAYPGTGPANTININNSDVTSLSGEWLQIYTSGVPLILSNYQLGTGVRTQFPKTYYVLGSNDNVNWYGIHKGTLSVQPSTDNSFNTTPITLTGTSYTGYSGTGTLGITIYNATIAGNSYRYFRIAIPAIFSTTGSSVAQLGEWKINFTTAATSSSRLSLDRLSQNQLNVSSGATFTGSVGIGITNPGCKLDIVSDNVIAPFNVRVGTTNALSVNGGGYVGIGTNTPNAKLAIYSTSTNQNESQIKFINGDTNSTTYTLQKIDAAENFFRMGRNGKSDIVIAGSNGYVGIGETNSPGSILVIQCKTTTLATGGADVGSNHGLQFRGAKERNPATNSFYGMVMGSDFTTGNGYIHCAGNNTVQSLMLQQHGGKVGIGSTAPTVALDVVGNVRCTGGYDLNYTDVPTYASNQIGCVLTKSDPGTWTGSVGYCVIGPSSTPSIANGIYIVSLYLSLAGTSLPDNFGIMNFVGSPDTGSNVNLGLSGSYIQYTAIVKFTGGSGSNSTSISLYNNGSVVNIAKISMVRIA